MDPIQRQQQAHERHFVQRARERFGLRVSPQRYRHACRLVEDTAPGVIFLHHQPPNRTVWSIRFGGHAMRVVYDHVSERLVTCLPNRSEQEHLAQWRRDRAARLKRLRSQGKTRRTSMRDRDGGDECN